VLVSLCVTRLLYAAETWTIKTADSSKLLTFEMRCYRRILRACWKDPVTNKSVREMVGRHFTIMHLIMQKLKLFGHICRMNQRLVKTMMMGMVESKEIGLVEDRQENGPTTSRTGVDVHCRRLYDWRMKDNSGLSGGESVASTDHIGHEF